MQGRKLSTSKRRSFVPCSDENLFDAMSLHHIYIIIESDGFQTVGNMCDCIAGLIKLLLVAPWLL